MNVQYFNSSQDYDDQQVILEILLKIKKSDPTLTMAEAAVILCNHFDIDYSTFGSKCGNAVKVAIKRDAIKHKQLRGYHNKRKPTVDDLFCKNRRV